MLRVGRHLISTEVNGPGRRFVIWLQGCDFRCPGCINPELLPMKGGELLSVDSLLQRIAQTTPIDGITLTGGEPFLQAPELVPLVRRIREEGRTVVCYTGRRLEELLCGSLPEAAELLAYVDILIDGPYLEAERAGLSWRGSRNQKVHFLSDRYRDRKSAADAEGSARVEIQVGSEGITVTGFFEPRFWEALQLRLAEGRRFGGEE